MTPAVRPIGFILLSLAMALLAAVFAAAVFRSEENWVARLLGGGIAILSLIVAEALWAMRPWLLRAIDAWALVCTLSAIAAGTVQVGPFSLGEFLLLSTLAASFVAMPCLLVRWYVRGHAATAGLLPARRPLPRTTP